MIQETSSVTFFQSADHYLLITTDLHMDITLFLH